MKRSLNIAYYRKRLAHTAGKIQIETENVNKNT